jgi:flagellar biosynthetic protein FliR
VTLSFPVTEIVGVALAFVRIAGVFVSAPVFSHKHVPVRVRAALVMLLSLVVAPLVDAAPIEEAQLASAVISEFGVGMAIGFAAALVFSGIGLMAELVSVQGGLGAASVLDPTSEASSVVVAALMRSFAILTFLAIDGHHDMLRALVLSYERVPLGVGLPITTFAGVASFGAIVFETGARLAAPLTVILLTSNVVVGILGRTIPQLNLVSLQLPAQVALTLLVIAAGASVIVDSLAGTISSGLDRSFSAVLGGR